MTVAAQQQRRKRYDYPVPKVLRQSSQIRIFGIGICGDDFIIEFVDKKGKNQEIGSYISGEKHNDIDTVRKLVESRLSNFFDNAATDYCTGKLTDVLDSYYDKEMAHAINEVKKRHRVEAVKLDGQVTEEEKQKPVYVVRKYSGVCTTSPNGQSLAEAVIINGEPLFACTINSGTSVTFFKDLETADMKLRPPTKAEYPPDSAYEYESEEEFMDYIRFAQEKDSLYNLYQDIRPFYTKEYFVDTDPRNSTLLAVYTITSHFQDKFSTVLYIWLIGDNGSGKNSILLTYSMLGYRVFYMAGASGPNLCEYLGTVEAGAGSIAEDELNDLDNDPYKRLLYMNGYEINGNVPKILDGSTKGREQRYYRSYCQKMSASENLPSMKYSKGVLDREFIIKCIKGFPKYNIKSTKKKTKTPEIMRLINKLDNVKKRLFAYRLVHYNDIIQDIQGINISGRALELTESALQLFYQFKVTEEDNKIFYNEITPALSSFLNDRLGRRSNSLEGKLYPIIKAMVDAQDGKDEFDNDTIFNTVCAEMEGREIPGKTNVFYVDELGTTITRTKIMKVLQEKFKAVPTYKPSPEQDGSRKRGHKFSKEALERIKASYEDEWEIKIVVVDSTSKEVVEDTSAQAARAAQVLDQKEGQKEEDNQAQKAESHEGIEREKQPDDPKNEGENTPPISTKPVQPVQPEPSYSIEDIIISIMKDEQGNKQDYFTLERWKTKLMLLPIQHQYHCNEDQAQQRLMKLLQQGKIREVDSGKYEPVS